jgi:hypothetical protein
MSVVDGQYIRGLTTSREFLARAQELVDEIERLSNSAGSVPNTNNR